MRSIYFDIELVYLRNTLIIEFVESEKKSGNTMTAVLGKVIYERYLTFTMQNLAGFKSDSGEILRYESLNQSSDVVAPRDKKLI
jgi:hypothetical protein